MTVTFFAAARGRAGARGGRPGVALLVIAAAQLMVVLDATVVYVALPAIQRGLGFSTSGLEWVVTAYALTFGGLLLLGGRAGDLLGRRRVFIAGLLLFSVASLAGGLATSPAWLLSARAVQGVGGAIVAPTALALIATTFAEGPPRNRAMGVYASMSGVGGALGLVAGGLLVTYADWRWVLFVNVPVGIAVAVAAPWVLDETPRRTGGLDLPGAVTGTGGIAALVYGLSNAVTTASGGARWGDPKVVASLTVGAVLLAAFAVIEARGRQPLLPPRVLRDRDRLGANLIMLGVGTANFGVFFFLTLFVQELLGYSPLREGVAFLPLTAALLVGAAIATRLIARAGARALLAAGAAASAGGTYWLSHITEHTGYAAGLLGPSLIAGLGLGLLFVPLPAVALSRVADSDSGVAASLVNTGRQVGGALGLAVLGSVAWTVTANGARSSRAAGVTPALAYQHALAAGLDRAFLVAAGLAALILVTALVAIRGERAPAGREAAPELT
jgi:EmrB/QacA subfamily drug resistance transporter